MTRTPRAVMTSNGPNTMRATERPAYIDLDDIRTTQKKRGIGPKRIEKTMHIYAINEIRLDWLYVLLGYDCSQNSSFQQGQSPSPSSPGVTLSTSRARCYVLEGLTSYSSDLDMESVLHERQVLMYIYCDATEPFNASDVSRAIFFALSIYNSPISLICILPALRILASSSLSLFH